MRASDTQIAGDLKLVEPPRYSFGFFGGLMLFKDLDLPRLPTYI